MMRQISMFTASADIERVLGHLMRTASATSRAGSGRVPLSELSAYFGSECGFEQLHALAKRLTIDASQLPTLEETRRLFQDEMLSVRALQLHRGRNVYSAGKAQLWRCWWLPFRDALTIGESTLGLLRTLVELRTHKGGDGVSECVKLLFSRLRLLDFNVELLSGENHAPILLAHRPALGMNGSVVLYGHYDVEEPDLDQWRTDPWTLTESDGRLYGVGVGDNKAALALRLGLLASMERTPEITWLIQGEEEQGSPLAHRLFPSLLAGCSPDLWIEENGYFDEDGTQRVLARTIGPQPDSSRPPDPPLERLIDQLAHDAGQHGLNHRVENRSLNKSFFPAGCPFNLAIPEAGRYLAIGVNDPQSAIHGPNESVPMWTFPVHARQLGTCMSWISEETSS